MAATYSQPQDLGSLREYVTGQSRMQQAADSTVLLHIAHNHLKARFPEIRLDLHVSRAHATPWHMPGSSGVRRRARWERKRPERAGLVVRHAARTPPRPSPPIRTKTATAEHVATSHMCIICAVCVLWRCFSRVRWRTRTHTRTCAPTARTATPTTQRPPPPNQMTVDAIRAKVNTHTGTSPDTMLLQLKDESGRLVASLDDGARKLGYYSPRNGCACGPQRRHCRGAPSLLVCLCVCVCVWGVSACGVLWAQAGLPQQRVCARRVSPARRWGAELASGAGKGSWRQSAAGACALSYAT